MPEKEQELLNIAEESGEWIVYNGTPMHRSSALYVEILEAEREATQKSMSRWNVYYKKEGFVRGLTIGLLVGMLLITIAFLFSY